jgi:uncharacterized LabA/DUF88 family protein
MQRARYAILIDGGFITKKLHARARATAAPGTVVHPASAADIIAECERLKALPQINQYELLRIYFYDAPPSQEKLKLPVSRGDHHLSTTPRARQAQSLYDSLAVTPDFALRMGGTSLKPNGWRLKPRVTKELIRTRRPLTDADFDLDIEQKGVDLRIGLDIARLALKDMVRAIVVVSGDSDLVPAFKFARREGVRIILDALGHGINLEMRIHADIVV